MRDKLQKENQRKYYDNYFNQRIKLVNASNSKNKSMNQSQGNINSLNGVYIKDLELEEQMFTLSNGVKELSNNLSEDALFIETGMSSLLNLVDQTLINVKIQQTIGSIVIGRERSNSKGKPKTMRQSESSHPANKSFGQQPMQSSRNNNVSTQQKAVQKQQSKSQYSNLKPSEIKSSQILTTKKKESEQALLIREYGNSILVNEYEEPINFLEQTNDNKFYEYDQQTLNLSVTSPVQQNQKVNNILYNNQNQSTTQNLQKNQAQSSSTQMLYNGSFSDLGIPVANTGGKNLGQNIKTRNLYSEKINTIDDSHSNQQIGSIVKIMDNGIDQRLRTSVDQDSFVNNTTHEEESLISKLEKTIQQKKQLQKSNSSYANNPKQSKAKVFK
ncbi:UNKNOWN [Stylonychia lemnae]|uniref:Uncharacterized protein n=1 Tax=Stylonychia lemnae TaxID=5949 RepID=A0A077ZUH4_STYLE|nr:UNKNOWN [Stylonychia lemnae]|eukprot:CDW73214.1 UNKNOWN [Stylonychia lemnae]